MAVYFNGTKLDVAVINGLQLTDIYVNNILVYSEESEYDISLSGLVETSFSTSPVLTVTKTVSSN